jgi:hypothetical protein
MSTRKRFYYLENANIYVNNTSRKRQGVTVTIIRCRNVWQLEANGSRGRGAKWVGRERSVRSKTYPHVVCSKERFVAVIVFITTYFIYFEFERELHPVLGILDVEVRWFDVDLPKLD